MSVGAFAYSEYRFHQFRREHVAGLAHASSSQPYNILLVGDNCRYCLRHDGRGYGSAAKIAGGRSDVTMLLRIDPATDRAKILSIPRDLWLPIPNSTGEIRVDAALNDGPGELVSTIEDDLDIPINHYVELNFDTFMNVVNVLGGLNFDFPDRAYDAYSHLNVPAGCYHLDGRQVLQVVRARHYFYKVAGHWRYDGLGDISRIQRDHEFLRVLSSTIAARGLGNPITDNDLVGAVSKDLTLDDTFSFSGLISLARTLSHVDLASAPERTLPVDEDTSPNGFTFQGEQFGDVVFPSDPVDRSVVDTFLGQPAPSSVAPTHAPVVKIVNGSGIAGQASRAAASLGRLGFHVSTTSTGPVYSSPAETVVYYAPGDEAAAQQLANDLGGAVSLGLDSQVAGRGLTLVTGSNMTVAAPAGQHAAGRTTRHAPTPAPGRTIGGVTPANPGYPSFDPRRCTAGAQARALPSLPIPTALSART